MACNTCSLYGCPNLVLPTGIAVANNAAEITIPNASYANHQRVCICINQNIPAEVTNATPVKVIINGSTDVYSIVKRNGNALYGDQLRRGMLLQTRVATDTGLFMLLNNCCCLPRSAHTFTNIPAAAVVNA